MGSAQMREELHQFINQADDRILRLVYSMMKADLDQELEASIEKGLQESKEGKVRPHKEVMAEIRSRYQG